MSEIQLTVSGMTCGHCQSAVTRALKAVPGVSDAQVDLQGGRATIQGNPTPQALIDAVTEEGYSAQVAASR